MRAGIFVQGSQLIGFACIVLLAGCNVANETPAVVYGSAAPVGAWKGEAASGAGAISGNAASPAGASGAVAGRSPLPSAGSASEGAVVSRAGSNGGAGMTIAAAGRGGAGGAGMAGRAAGGVGGQPAAGSGTAGSAGNAPSSSATSLAFDVTTSAVGGRYQPKNIGAIWVQDKNGKLVKSLAVWAGIRRRYLTRYASALAGGAIDVTSSATLPSHRAHHVTWTMQDRTGAPVPAGSYMLVMELTDGDMTGRSSTVAFDTSLGSQMLAPPNAPSFNAMTLQLQ